MRVLGRYAPDRVGIVDRHVLGLDVGRERKAVVFPALVNENVETVLSAVFGLGRDLAVLVEPAKVNLLGVPISPAERAGAGQRAARKRLGHAQSEIARAENRVGHKLHVVFRHVERDFGVVDVVEVVVKGRQTRRLGRPAQKGGDRARGLAAHGHHGARLVAAQALAVECHGVVGLAGALPHVAALVGTVAHVVAAHVHVERVGLVVLDAFADTAVTRDAGAHTDLGVLAHAARDVGARRAAGVVAQKQVVGVAGFVAARVAGDVYRALELDVVVAPNVDAAALVVAAAIVAVIVLDDGVLDGVVLVADVDAAALVVGAVARDGALLDNGVLLVKLDAAAVPVRVVVDDLEVLDRTAVRAVAALVDVDTAAARTGLQGSRAVFQSDVARDLARSVHGLERELRVVKVDAAARPGLVLADLGAALQVDIHVGARKDAAALAVGVVLDDLGTVHVERGVAADLDAGARGRCGVRGEDRALVQVDGAARLGLDAALAAAGHRHARDRQGAAGVHVDAGAAHAALVGDQAARGDLGLLGLPLAVRVLDGALVRDRPFLARLDGELRVLFQADALGVPPRRLVRHGDGVAVHIDGELFAVGNVQRAAELPVRKQNERLVRAVRGAHGRSLVCVVGVLARGVLHVGNMALRKGGGGRDGAQHRAHGDGEYEQETIGSLSGQRAGLHRYASLQLKGSFWQSRLF